MGDRVDEAAIEQRQARDRESRVGRVSVRPVALLQHRRRAVARKTLAVDERHRHLAAVPRRRPDEFGDVVGRREIAEDRLALQERPGAGAHVVVVRRVRRGERGVGVANQIGIELGILPEARGVGGLVRRDEEVLAAGERPDADFPQSARAFADGEKAVEHVETVDEGVVAVRQDLAPSAAVGLLAHPGLHQAEVRRLPVRADDPAVVEVLGVVRDDRAHGRKVP